MMEKRYQVFVSSTYDDLQEERQQVMHALLELDCIPAGMELFPAADESQWSVIKRVIDDCDYYVVILAGRYGSCDADGVGYTEKEYRYALEIGKPTIAFLHKNPGEIPQGKSESSEEGQQKLAAFRSLLEQKLCKHWSTPDELGSVVSRSVVRLIKDSPAIGWVRADELPDRDAALELLKLRRRVEELESELARVRTTAPRGSEDLAQGDEPQTLRYSFFTRNSETYAQSRWNATLDTTWNSIFGAVAPLMISEVSERGMESALAQFVRDEETAELRRELLGPKDHFEGFALNDQDFQTVKVQLKALGLITKSDKSRSLKDTATYWTLTPYGDEVMTRLRAVKRGAAESEESDSDETE